MNIWIFYGIVFLLSLAVLISAFWKQNQVVAGFIAVLSTIFIRIVQTNNPYRHPGDSYYYWHVPEAILRNGDLSADKSVNWYPGVERLIESPAMHIVTSNIVEITGIIDLSFARAIVPALYGGVFFILTVAIAKIILSREWCVVVAYTIAQKDAVIFYQTQYHAQNFGLLFITLLTLVFIWMHQTTDDSRGMFLFIPVVVSLVMAHRLSSAVAAIIFILMVFAVGIYAHLSRTAFPRLKLVQFGFSVALLSIISAVFHVFINYSVFETSIVRAVYIIGGEGIGFAREASAGVPETPTIIDRFSIYTKILLVISAIPSIIYSFLRDHDDSVLIMLAFLGATGPTAILISILSFEVLTRIILIAFVPLTLIAFYTFQNHIPTVHIKQLAAGFALILIILGVASGTIPSLIDPTSDIRADGYQNVEPMSGQHKAGGYWIQNYTTGETMGVSRYTLHSAMTFGHQPINDIVFLADVNQPPPYLIVDEGRETLDSDTRIYSNGRIAAGRS